MAATARAQVDTAARAQGRCLAPGLARVALTRVHFSAAACCVEAQAGVSAGSAAMARVVPSLAAGMTTQRIATNTDQANFLPLVSIEAFQRQ